MILFLALSLNLRIKSIIILTATANVSFTCCKVCGKQYTGKTVDKFSSRPNNYKTSARKAASGNIERCKQRSLQNHFLKDDHHGFLEYADSYINW